MGNHISRVASDFVIHVTTADRKDAGTDADVTIVLTDSKGNKSKELELDNLFRDDFERGRTDTFAVRGEPDLVGDIVAIELWRNTKGLLDDWMLEKIVVERVKPQDGQKEMSTFPIYRWIPPHTHLHFVEYDMCLPQFDPNPEMRKIFLRTSRKLYEYEHVPELPPKVSTMYGAAGLDTNACPIARGKYKLMADLKCPNGQANIPT